MLEAVKFREVNDRGYFVGVEHSLHCRFDEVDGDVIGQFAPDVVAGEFFYPLTISFLFLVGYWVNLNQNSKHRWSTTCGYF
jgi:hypothetical protein